ncbi:hypothetical protein E2C01_010235 [Portunus trituberculatus]|uniref:Uncharacterized protein n=1 Tax=Portunus trituberculatus TaxID=210409 RepID=A0A5B7D854_PORTR|nr:hypothetical protein [Portunus trituberculatus]
MTEAELSPYTAVCFSSPVQSTILALLTEHLPDVHTFTNWCKPSPLRIPHVPTSPWPLFSSSSPPTSSSAPPIVTSSPKPPPVSSSVTTPTPPLVPWSPIAMTPPGASEALALDSPHPCILPSSTTAPPAAEVPVAWSIFNSVQGCLELWREMEYSGETLIFPD